MKGLTAQAGSPTAPVVTAISRIFEAEKIVRGWAGSFSVSGMLTTWCSYLTRHTVVVRGQRFSPVQNGRSCIVFL